MAQLRSTPPTWMVLITGTVSSGLAVLGEERLSTAMLTMVTTILSTPSMILMKLLTVATWLIFQLHRGHQIDVGLHEDSPKEVMDDKSVELIDTSFFTQ